LREKELILSDVMVNLFKKVLSYRYIRFLLIGLVNTVFGYGLYAFFIFIGLHYSLAVFFGTILGILFNFQTIGRFVFKKIAKSLFLRFVSVYVFSYCLNIILIYLFKKIGFNDYSAGAILILPVSFIVYLLNSKYVFQK